MNVWTKRGYDIFSPTDAAGLLRSVLNGDVQVWSTEVERAVYYAMVSGNLAYATKADLDADLAHDDGTVAWVVADTEALNGIYVKSGASGSGSWTKERNLPTGPQGDVGGVAYRFDAGTADADPGAGLIRANNANLSAATELYVSKTNRYGDDLSGFLATLAGSTSSHKGYLVLTAPDSETQAAFGVTGVTDATGYVKLAVTGQGGATAFSDAERLEFLFSRTGNAGDLNGVSPGPTGLALLETATPAGARSILEIGSIETFVTPEAHGALANGSDDAAAIEAAAAAAVSQNKVLYLAPGKTYTFSKIALPACRVQTNGAVLRTDGSNPADYALQMDGTEFLDELSVSAVGTETAAYLLRFEKDTIIPRGSLVADSQHTTTGIYIADKGCRIGSFHCDKIDRPYDIRGDRIVGDNPTLIGFLSCHSYKRGIYAPGSAGWTLGGYRMTGRSPNTTFGPGNNGVLIDGSDHLTIGDGEIDDAHEHAFRIGGDTNKHITVGKIVARRPGGCAFKMASGGINPGDPLTSNVSVDRVIGVDCGYGELGNNRGLLRIAHAEQFHIGPSSAYAEAASVGAPRLIQINDVKDFEIEATDGTYLAGLVIDEMQDISGFVTGGNVENCRIALAGTAVSNEVFAINMPTYNHNNVVLEFDVLIDGGPRLGTFAAINLTGPLHVVGKTRGAVAPSIQNAPTDDRFYYDIITPSGRYAGRYGFDFSADAPLQVGVPEVDPANVKTSRGLMISSFAATAGSGEHGGGLEFTGPGSDRRRIAVVPKQMSAAGNDIALVLMMAATTASNDVVADRFIFRRDGKLMMVSPNGNWWACGPNDSGTWVCTAATNP